MSWFFEFKVLLKAIFLLPNFFIVAIMIGLFADFRTRRGTLDRQLSGRKRWPRAVAWFGLIGLWLCATPWVADRMTRALESPLQALSAAQLAALLVAPNPPAAIVILGGGQRTAAPEQDDRVAPSPLSLERLTYGAQLARQSGLPILVSGGLIFPYEVSEAQVMTRTLKRAFGLTPKWIEDQSIDTAQNALESATLLKRDGVTRIILVSHSLHLLRAKPLFEQFGLNVVNAPAAMTGELPFHWRMLVPGAGAMQKSWLASHELVGWAYQSLAKILNPSVVF
jgi:uncharacterized SAM-binding protein YcdF (DUF218 family)